MTEKGDSLGYQSKSNDEAAEDFGFQPAWSFQRKPDALAFLGELDSPVR